MIYPPDPSDADDENENEFQDDVDDSLFFPNEELNDEESGRNDFYEDLMDDDD